MSFNIKCAPDIISARTNPLIVRLCKLDEKKYREEEKLFRLDGIKLLLEAIHFGAEIEYILVREDTYDMILDLLSRHAVGEGISVDGTLIRLSCSAFEKLSSEKSPEGVITIAKYIDKIHKICKIEKDSVLSADGRTLMMESVRDPGNLGTMLRSAAAFGFSSVIMTSDCADIYNPKTVRAAMGAIFKLNIIRVEEAPSAIAAIRGGGRRVLAAALDEKAIRLGEFKLDKNDVFLIGNEGHGLSKEAIKAADKTVYIPMAEGTESLNAAIAAAVCMWEMSKI